MVGLVSDRVIKVGLTEKHGMAHETSLSPPANIEYSFPQQASEGPRWVSSTLKGYLREFSSGEVDIFEAVLSPIITNQPWICSLDCFQAALNFRGFGIPVPRALRAHYIKSLFKQPNFKRLIFWSEAARESLHSYGGINDRDIEQKVTVVYPAIREVELNRSNSKKCFQFLFSGDFFRKGGANVIDAFERLQASHPNILLRLCCSEQLDFNTNNKAMKSEYLDRIRKNPRIVMARVPRNQLLKEILPETDVYLLPTYIEAFGFAILEAMAHGIPVIATNHFAIPEIIEDGVSGLLINTRNYDTEAMFRGYVVNEIPPGFKASLSNQLFEHMEAVIASQSLREHIAANALRVIRTKFSFDRRNVQMRRIYEEALSA
jgi:glycosyltransferase involved in cell wall biosynthesis